MIEQLEPRALFSITPAHAALNVLRADVASIGHTINAMITADNAAIANLQSDVAIFPTHLTSDHSELQALNARFRINVSNLANDFNNIKVFLGQDITQLIDETNAYSRHPTAGIGQAFVNSEQLITAEGNAAVTVLSQDTDDLESDYVADLTGLPVSHPTDATLGIRASNIVNTLSNNVGIIQDAANTVAQTDVANFIAALDPNGVVSPDRTSIRKL